jgi:flagellar basal body-associated protein FliL
MKNNIGVPAIIGAVIAVLAVVGGIYYFVMGSGSGANGATAGVGAVPVTAAGTADTQKRGEQYGKEMAQSMQQRMQKGGPPHR